MLITAQEFRGKLATANIRWHDLHMGFNALDQQTQETKGTIPPQVDAYAMLCAGCTCLTLGFFDTDEVREDMSVFACKAHDLRIVTSH